MIFELTASGISALNANPGVPPVLTVAKLGDGVNYAPDVSDTNIHGIEIHSLTPSLARVLNTNVLVYTVYLEPSVGDFNFGEVGLFLPGNVLFALGATSSLITKNQNTALNNGNAIRIECYISTVGSNQTIYSSVVNTERSRFNATGSIDALPSAVDAQSAAYIVPNPTSPEQSLVAVSNNSTWTVSNYVQQVGRGKVDSNGVTSIAVSYTDLPLGGEPVIAYPGYLLVQIITGECAGSVRIVKSCSPTEIEIFTPFYNQLNIDDVFTVVACNVLPQVSASLLGGLSANVTAAVLNEYAANGGLGGLMKLDGSQAMTGDMNLDGHRIKNAVPPVDDDDVVTKKFLQDELYRINLGGTDTPIFNTMEVKGDTGFATHGGKVRIGQGSFTGLMSDATLQVAGYAWAGTPSEDADNGMLATTEWVRAYIASVI